eukprot:GHVU01041083.1.p1 GENE.GHVU01041083.1~~GHVU01041083.1.p1  ORF type:complete len:594 (+),score=53.12 GHVU01041083.1:375-2156(+)
MLTTSLLAGIFLSVALSFGYRLQLVPRIHDIRRNCACPRTLSLRPRRLLHQSGQKSMFESRADKIGDLSEVVAFLDGLSDEELRRRLLERNLISSAASGMSRDDMIERLAQYTYDCAEGADTSDFTGGLLEVPDSERLLLEADRDAASEGFWEPKYRWKRPLMSPEDFADAVGQGKTNFEVTDGLKREYVVLKLGKVQGTERHLGAAWYNESAAFDLERRAAIDRLSTSEEYPAYLVYPENGADSFRGGVVLLSPKGRKVNDRVIRRFADRLADLGKRYVIVPGISYNSDIARRSKFRIEAPDEALKVEIKPGIRGRTADDSECKPEAANTTGIMEREIDHCIVWLASHFGLAKVALVGALEGGGAALNTSIRHHHRHEFAHNDRPANVAVEKSAGSHTDVPHTATLLPNVYTAMATDVEITACACLAPREYGLIDLVGSRITTPLVAVFADKDIHGDSSVAAMMALESLTKKNDKLIDFAFHLVRNRTEHDLYQGEDRDGDDGDKVVDSAVLMMASFLDLWLSPRFSLASLMEPSASSSAGLSSNASVDDLVEESYRGSSAMSANAVDNADGHQGAEMPPQLARDGPIGRRL